MTFWTMNATGQTIAQASSPYWAGVEARGGQLHLRYPPQQHPHFPIIRNGAHQESGKPTLRLKPLQPGRHRHRVPRTFHRQNEEASHRSVRHRSSRRPPPLRPHLLRMHAKLALPWEVEAPLVEAGVQTEKGAGKGRHKPISQAHLVMGAAPRLVPHGAPDHTVAVRVLDHALNLHLRTDRPAKCSTGWSTSVRKWPPFTADTKHADWVG